MTFSLSSLPPAPARSGERTGRVDRTPNLPHTTRGGGRVPLHAVPVGVQGAVKRACNVERGGTRFGVQAAVRRPYGDGTVERPSPVGQVGQRAYAAPWGRREGRIL
ncbi:unnamed protein product [marine sediment metagenome]|uniref:Uncharacterized protein n=1 Tax=marine sediment metagenome TaxID=412755 RepID=X0WTQ7_9ZZZZ